MFGGGGGGGGGGGWSVAGSHRGSRSCKCTHRAWHGGEVHSLMKSSVDSAENAFPAGGVPRRGTARVPRSQAKGIQLKRPDIAAWFWAARPWRAFRTFAALMTSAPVWGFTRMTCPVMRRFQLSGVKQMSCSIFM